LPGLVKETTFFTAKSNPSRDEELKHSPDIEFKALNYTELIPVMIKGVQEQQGAINNLQQENEALKQQITELKQMITGNAKSSGSDGAYLLQNAPNPFNQNTTVSSYVPASVKKAQLMVYNMDGRLINTFTLTNGRNTVSIGAGSLPAGQYSYTLLADGKKIDTKSMTITK